MAQAFKAGEIVQLKSGGPRMTLTSVDDRGYVRTAWFAGAAKEHGYFHLDALTRCPNRAAKETDAPVMQWDPG
jgi:uncharacterized protein YodC (DUF2158 family)